MSRGNHIAVRTCMGCGERASQSDLIRIARCPSGDLGVDEDRRAGGRGGYLHRNDKCWKTFSRRRGMVRSFRAPVRSQARATLLNELSVVAGL